MLGLVMSIIVTNAQEIDLPSVVTEEQIQAEITKRGLNEEEVREALTAAGFDMDDLSNIRPEQLPELQSVIDELVAKKSATEIIDAVEIDNDIDKEKKDKLENDDNSIVEEVIEVIEEELDKKEIYGHRMFRNKEIKFYSNKDGIRAPDYYILDSGDEIAISIFGNSYKEGNYTINSSGFIQILNGQKKVSLKGITLAQANKKLKRVFSSYYKFKDDEFNLTLNYSRPVTVSVYGEVMKPGAITLPAINNVFNALAAVEGPNKIGSVRKIQVVKKNGRRVEVDLFDYINNPSSNKSFFLSDNDMIIVPSVDLVVDVSGAINRPMLYELKKGEGLKTLIDFAGGFTKQAYTKSLKVERFKNNERVFIDIDYTNQNHFPLQNGDAIYVKEISTSLTNYVTVEGEVVSPGQYERRRGMKILDLIKKAGLKDETRLDLIYLKRIGDDNKVSYSPINLENIISSPSSPLNMVLKDKDQLTLWPKELFLEKGSVRVTGAVRDSTVIEVNGNKDLKVGDAIMLAGGLRSDASTRAMIYRQDPLRKNEIQYINLDLEKGDSSYEVLLKSKDVLEIYSNNLFTEKSVIVVNGAVNNPSTFQYGSNMTLKQALILAGGTKKSAAKNRVEVSRVIMKDNEPTQVVIAVLEIDNEFNVVNDADGFDLRPFDNINVRYVPDFEMQQTISLIGEVKYPGNYAIISENETILDVINRAGGVTNEAFPEGASLFRSKDSLGFLIIKLDEVLKDRNNRFNFKLREGDKISIPKINDFVAIRGATKAKYVLDDKLLNEFNEIHVPYQRGKSLKYYVEEYAGGFDIDADRSKVSVMYPNGGIKSSKNYVLYRKYPEVTKGSTISVGYKKKKPKKLEKDKKDVDWGKIVNNTIAQATSLLTLLLITKNLSK